MLEVTHSKNSDGTAKLSYRYVYGPGEPKIDETITQAELIAAGVWSKIIWPKDSIPPDKLSPAVEYQVDPAVTATQWANGLRSILGPRMQAAIASEQETVSVIRVSLLK